METNKTISSISKYLTEKVEVWRNTPIPGHFVGLLLQFDGTAHLLKNPIVAEDAVGGRFSMSFELSLRLFLQTNGNPWLPYKAAETFTKNVTADCSETPTVLKKNAISILPHFLRRLTPIKITKLFGLVEPERQRFSPTHLRQAFSNSSLESQMIR